MCNLGTSYRHYRNLLLLFFIILQFIHRKQYSKNSVKLKINRYQMKQKKNQTSSSTDMQYAYLFINSSAQFWCTFE